MSRYIDLEEFERRIKKYIKPEIPEEKEFVEWCTDECIRQGYAMPTADVVQVVRCKDCAVPHNRWTGCPILNGLVTPPDFYCSYGERKKECKECPEN